MTSITEKAQSIFLSAIEEHEPEAWPAFLDVACADDVALRGQVEKLLRAHAELGTFHERPAVAPTIDQPITEKPGTVIDRYKLLEQIGEGGFGVVFMAEQEEPVKRRVALKVIKPGMDTKEVIARFEAERQALAIMDHPNIAKVLDAGATESGRPYFVMELVRGIPITDFCDKNSLSARERLELFVSVCQAVQHAHQKGIIHRDIKPTNVMVTLRDDTPVAKVIDFGVAKATNARLTEQTLFTRFGQMVGTPLYMSPEQAGMSELDIDTRSDIYSLGVLLYELLTGATPFDQQRIRRAAYDELLKIIREEEPPKPSLRISTLGDTLPSVAAHRKLAPKKLSALIRGELDWIVMKALEKDRTRRYETANGFAADVERYLSDQPVQACPPSAGYRFRKFVRQNKTALVAVALVVISLLAGTGMSIWQAVRAIEAEQLAQRRLEDVGKQQQEAEAHHQRAEANLQLALETLEQIYLPLAEDQFSELTDLTERDRQFLQKALPFYEQLAAQKADDPQMLYVKAQAYLRVGNIYVDLRTHPDEKNEPAEAALRQAIALFQQLVGEFPGELEFQQKLAQSYGSLGRLLDPRRQPEAEQAYRTAIAFYEPVVLESGNAGDYASRATCYRRIKRYDMALADLRKAVELEPNNAYFHYALCSLYADWLDVRLRGQPLAVEHGQKAVELEPDNPKYHAGLAYAYKWQGNLQAAREACAQALSLDANQPSANRTMAEVLRRQGDFDQALAFAEKAVQDYRHLPQAVNAYKTRGQVYAKLGRYQEALADFNKGMELKPGIAYMHMGRGHVHAEFGRYQEALADYTKAVELGPESLAILNDTARAIVLYPGWETQAVAQAVNWAQQAVELRPESYQAWNTLGMAHYRAGNWQEAIAALDKSETLSPRQRRLQRLLRRHGPLAIGPPGRSPAMVREGRRVDGE
jgi:tetratricopeptide (TPR) repeat protein/tRNA A-37 threonylcarbamoyl transferase component Bud32